MGGGHVFLVFITSITMIFYQVLGKCDELKDYFKTFLSTNENTAAVPPPMSPVS